MKRKVARIGPSTLMVSLPSQWARKFNLKKGCEVHVETKENQVIISTEAMDKPKATNLDVSNLGAMMLRYLVALYKKGYDEVRISFSEPNMIEKIQEAIGKEAVGYEIMEQGKRNLVIRNISETLTDYDSTLRRTMRLLVSMSEECTLAFQKGEFDLLKNIAFLEEANNRFTTTLRRALNKKGYTDFSKTNLLYYIVEELEKIADQYKYLCNYFYSKKNEKVSLKNINLLKDAGIMLKNYSEIYFKYDESKIVNMNQERKRLIAESLKDLEKGNKYERVLAHYILTITQEIFCLVGPYLAMVL